MTYNEVHKLYRVAKFHEYDRDVERELILETAMGDGTKEEIHLGVWKDDSENIGTFIALTPEEALEVGENLIARATALLNGEDN